MKLQQVFSEESEQNRKQHTLLKDSLKSLLPTAPFATSEEHLLLWLARTDQGRGKPEWLVKSKVK